MQNKQFITMIKTKEEIIKNSEDCADIDIFPIIKVVKDIKF